MEKYLISEAFENLGSKRKLFEAASLKVKDRIAIAENRSTSPDILLKLAKDSDEHVRAHVAGNLNTPSEALKLLAEDSDEYVRLRIARNPNTSLESLKRLANDENEDIRKIANGRIPYEVDQEDEFGYTDDEFDDY